MEIWIRLIEGQNLKSRCRCFATFFCSDAVFVIFSFRGVALWTVPQCAPPYYTISRYGTVIHSTRNLECPGFPYMGRHSSRTIYSFWRRLYKSFIHPRSCSRKERLRLLLYTCYNKSSLPCSRYRFFGTSLRSRVSRICCPKVCPPTNDIW